MYQSADIQLVSEHGRRHLHSSSYTAAHSLFHAHVPGPRVWNSLLATIRQITSYGQFGQRMKTHLSGAQKSQRIVTLVRYTDTYSLTLRYDECVCVIFQMMTILPCRLSNSHPTANTSSLPHSTSESLPYLLTACMRLLLSLTVEHCFFIAS